MSSVQTVTPVSAPVSAVARILEMFAALGTLFNDSRAASAALAMNRRHKVEGLAFEICDLKNEDDAAQIRAEIAYIATSDATKKHALRNFAKTLNTCIAKIDDGRKALNRQ